MEIKRYQPNDEVEIAKLFKLAFHRDLGEDYWKWRFKENPYKKNQMINLMWEGKTLIGHHSVSAIEVVYKNKIILATLAGTGMTHPDFEGQGIFGKLALDLYNRNYNDFGIETIITFPNRPASHYSLIRKIGYKNIAYLPTLTIDANLIENFDIGRISTIDIFNSEHSEFMHKSIQDLGFEIYTNRSIKYLNWRYNECPITEYIKIQYKEKDELKGVLIAKIYKPNDKSNEVDIDIVDLFCSDDITIMSGLFSGIMQSISKHNYNVKKFYCWISLFDRRHAIMERLGFVTATPITYFCVKSLGTQFEEVKQFEKWYISMSDNDIY